MKINRNLRENSTNQENKLFGINVKQMKNCLEFIILKVQEYWYKIHVIHEVLDVK